MCTAVIGKTRELRSALFGGVYLCTYVRREGYYYTTPAVLSPGSFTVPGYVYVAVALFVGGMGVRREREGGRERIERSVVRDSFWAGSRVRWIGECRATYVRYSATKRVV